MKFWEVRSKIDFTKKIFKHRYIYIYCFFNCENSSVKFNLKMIFYNLEKINKFFLIKIRCFFNILKENVMMIGNNMKVNDKYE